MRNQRLVRGPVGLLAALAAVVYSALAWAPKRRSRPRAVRANVADVAAGVEVEEALFEDGLHEGGVDVFVEVHQMRDRLLQNNAGDVFRRNDEPVCRATHRNDVLLDVFVADLLPELVAAAKDEDSDVRRDDVSFHRAVGEDELCGLRQNCVACGGWDGKREVGVLVGFKPLFERLGFSQLHEPFLPHRDTLVDHHLEAVASWEFGLVDDDGHFSLSVVFGGYAFLYCFENVW